MSRRELEANEVELDGWYDVRSESVHRVIDGGFRRMRTKCGIRIRQAITGATKRRRCAICERMTPKRQEKP